MEPFADATDVPICEVISLPSSAARWRDLCLDASGTQRFEVLGHHGHRLGVLVAGAELDDLGSREPHFSGVTRPDVVRLSLLERLVPLGPMEDHPSFDHVPPVVALAQVIGEAPIHGGKVRRVLERLQPEDVAVGLHVAAFEPRHALHPGISTRASPCFDNFAIVPIVTPFRASPKAPPAPRPGPAARRTPAACTWR